MTTLKKWWNKFTTKAKSIKERFTEIIRARLTNNPGGKSATVRYVTAVVLAVIAMVGVVFFTPIVSAPATWLLEHVLLGPIWLQAVQLFFFFTLPAVSFISDSFAKMFVFILAPWMTHAHTPVKNAINYPRTVVSAINGVVLALVGITAASGVILINAANKVIWLIEMIVGLPYDVFQTKSFEGFKVDMRAWFLAWTPEYFMEGSLGDVMAKQFRVEHLKEEEAARKPKTQKAPQQPKQHYKTKMAPVTPLPST